jgi:D-aspartate ligase
LIVDTRVPVIMLKAGGTGALGAIRSLGRLGVRVYCIEAGSSIPGLKSRYCSAQFSWDIDNALAEDSLVFLASLARLLGGKPLLFPTDYTSTLFIAENNEVLRQNFAFASIARHTMELLGNKQQMHSACMEHGIATPNTVVPRSRQDALAFAATATFPIVLKPIDPSVPLRIPAERVVITRNKQELLAAYDRMDDAQLLLQEYIPGGDETQWMFNGYFNEDSECLFGATGKKLRQFPAYKGVTSLGICIRNQPVEEITKSLMKSVGYRGILDIGYRYDARDGKYKLLDVNPRIGATSRLFVAKNGIDVARSWYLDLTAQPVPASTVAEGRKWAAEDKDLFSSFRYYRDEKLTGLQWIKSFHGVKELAYCSFVDPVPAMQRAWNLLTRTSEQSETKNSTSGISPSAKHKPVFGQRTA